MARANLILTLAKVIIAAAWADGRVAHDEINSLKDLLFRLPDMTGREWGMLEMYIEAPVGADERLRLVEQLQSELRSPSDKKLAVDALEEMIHADGRVTPAEESVLAEIKGAIEEVDVGIFGQIGRLVRGPLDRRSDATESAPNREAFLEDFIKNKVFYEIRRRMEMGEAALPIPEKDLRKLSLAGGLMARIAHVDQEVSPKEFSRMSTALQTGWGIDESSAAFVTQVAISEVSADLDYYRLCREFFDTTREEERLAFLQTLFAVAASDGMATHDELEEIRTIANSLKIPHSQYIRAKLTIPRDKRAS